MYCIPCMYKGFLDYTTKKEVCEVHVEKRFERFKDGGLNVSRAGASASRLLVRPVGGARPTHLGSDKPVFGNRILVQISSKDV